jgi:hypothetical protein
MKLITNIQKITQSVLYYTMDVYPTVRMSLNDIATDKTKSTEKAQALEDQLLDYLVAHPDATIIYILHIHSDASYLSVSHALIRLSGLFYCGDNSLHADRMNGSILDTAVIIKHEVASAVYS